MPQPMEILEGGGGGGVYWSDHYFFSFFTIYGFFPFFKVPGLNFFE